MNNDFHIILIYKNLKGEISTSEKQRLDLWMENPEHAEIERNLRNDWHLSGNYEPQIMVDDIDLEEEYALLQDRIKQDANHQSKTVQLKPRKNAWMKYAAAIALLIVAGLCIFNPLGSGDVHMANYTTSDNEIKVITLSDGTEVTLNENSTFTYPESFPNDSRKVILDGEAFFDVAHNPEKPFSIETPHTITTVLGTSFNLEDYNDADFASVAVVTGKVRFEDKENDENQSILTKGNRAKFVKTTQLIITEEINAINDNSWNTNILTFNDTPMENIILDIEHHFGISIDYSESITNCSSTSRFNLNKTDLDGILNDLSNAFQADLEKVNNDKYIIKGGTCK